MRYSVPIDDEPTDRDPKVGTRRRALRESLPQTREKENLTELRKTLIWQKETENHDKGQETANF